MAAARRKTPPAPAKPPPSDPVVITLPATVGYAAAGQLHVDLSSVQGVPDVALDAGGVEKLSTASVLVVVSFLNARATLTPPAAVINASGPFVDAFSDLGMFGKLMKMEFRT